MIIKRLINAKLWLFVKSTSELAVGSGSSNPKRKAPKINPSKSPKPENLTRNPKI